MRPRLVYGGTGAGPLGRGASRILLRRAVGVSAQSGGRHSTKEPRGREAQAGYCTSNAVVPMTHRWMGLKRWSGDGADEIRFERGYDDQTQGQ
jgi:hypothetical protein